MKAALVADPGCVLMKVDEYSTEAGHRAYTFATRDGEHHPLTVRRSGKQIEVSTYHDGIRKSSFEEHELGLVQPYTGWDRYKRFAWYAASHFLQVSTVLAADTSITDEIADLAAEKKRITERIRQLNHDEVTRHVDAGCPTIPETANI